jgi:RNA polymerase sigma-70 factor (ECF subfamily)
MTAEADLLRGVDAALKAGNAARALAKLDQHRATFPSGMLVEEREAERVVVLCALGRTDEARAAASVFLRDRPRSPLAGRVRASCGGR